MFTVIYILEGLFKVYLFSVLVRVLAMPCHGPLISHFYSFLREQQATTMHARKTKTKMH
jgi:hypothetical protein